MKSNLLNGENSVRIFAYDKQLSKSVRVTLRKPVLDLTRENICLPCYTHINGKTVSGRLVNSSTQQYEFVRV
jgi:hypothetical protein